METSTTTAVALQQGLVDNTTLLSSAGYPSDVFNMSNFSNSSHGNISVSAMPDVLALRFVPYTILAAVCFVLNLFSLLAMLETKRFQRKVRQLLVQTCHVIIMHCCYWSKLKARRIQICLLRPRQIIPLLLVRACHVALEDSCYWLIQVRHVLLINLAVCDLVGSVLLWMYQNAYQIFPRFTADRPIHCLFIFSVLVAPFVLSLCISAFSLLLLALNQLVAICRPLFATSRLAPRHAVIG
jgi:hypothetical protein